jgi:hypothetical protein
MLLLWQAGRFQSIDTSTAEPFKLPGHGGISQEGESDRVIDEDWGQTVRGGKIWEEIYANFAGCDRSKWREGKWNIKPEMEFS